jgi:glucokinase
VLKRVIIGVDLGGTKIAAGAVTPAGDILVARTVPTPAAEGAETVLGTIMALVADVTREADEEGWPAAGIGLATPGVVHPRDGTVVYATPTLPGWSGLRLRDSVAAASALPTVVLNDAHAAAWGEWRAGAGRGATDMVMVTLGTGVGGGVVVGGVPLMGSQGAAARIGHVSVDTTGPRCYCGGIGCLELYASGIAIARAAQAALDQGVDTALRSVSRPLTAAHVVEAGRAGDPYAVAALATAGQYLGVALAALVALFNPQVVVFGGGLSEAGDLLLGPADREMRNRILPLVAESLSLRLAKLGGHAAVVGVALWAWRDFGLSPDPTEAERSVETAPGPAYRA